jgi:predicted amidohydrolase
MKLKISLAQFEVINSRPPDNLAKAEKFIKDASSQGSGLICFPEMFVTGFNWNFLNEDKNNFESYINKLASFASENKIWINGSMPELNSEGKICNTSILFNPEGKRAATYAKIHLFSYMKENEHLASGNKLAEANAPWGKTGLSVCYDLRFPGMFQTYALSGVKLQLHPAAWPYPRLEHWQVLTKARAIENQMFIAAVNQVGEEDFGEAGKVTYFGNSMLIDPWGKVILQGNDKDECLLNAEIDLDLVDEIRSTITVFEDRRTDVCDLTN